MTGSTEESATDQPCEDLRDLVETIEHCRERIREFVDEGKMVAMNTSIEASRLGEQGRGFQILADHLSRLLAEAGAVSDMLTRAAVVASAATRRSAAEADDPAAR